jgi:hypothetical protein
MEQSRSEWHDDLIAIKMFKKPANGGMGHFWFAILHVGRREILIIADGLVNEGAGQSCSLCLLTRMPQGIHEL